MRASERKGAWILMAGIVLLGFILWIFGKCQGGNNLYRPDDNSNIEIKALSTDSTGVSQDSSSKKERSKRKGAGIRKTVKIVGKSTVKVPVRDILADTIPVNEIK